VSEQVSGSADQHQPQHVPAAAPSPQGMSCHGSGTAAAPCLAHDPQRRRGSTCTITPQPLPSYRKCMRAGGSLSVSSSEASCMLSSPAAQHRGHMMAVGCKPSQQRHVAAPGLRCVLRAARCPPAPKPTRRACMLLRPLPHLPLPRHHRRHSHCRIHRRWTRQRPAVSCRACKQQRRPAGRLAPGQRGRGVVDSQAGTTLLPRLPCAWSGRCAAATRTFPAPTASA